MSFLALALAGPGVTAQAPVGPSSPSLEEVLRRVSQYVAAYGAQAVMFVGSEAYVQRLDTWPKPRRLLSEYAIVKGGTGSAWAGYRDVAQVDDRPVRDRQDRLLRLLSAPTVDAGQLKLIDDESARYNIGPISRNFNVPTTALFFFDSQTIGRFSFETKGTTKIDGVTTWELEFKETRRPTLVRTRKGRDVPCTGRIWVAPGDGTVVRTRLLLRDFADDQALPLKSPAPSSRLVDTYVPGVGTVTTASGSAAPTDTTERIESLAVIEVTYRLDARFGAWLPSKMSELYEGPMPVPGRPTRGQGRATGLAEYSDFKRFETSGRLVPPK